MAAKEFLQKGINCIEYKDGRRVNIADYAQMALRTAAIRSYLQGEGKRRAELGIDTVLVSQYGACSETCLPWQGRVYIDDVWGGFAGETDDTRGKSRNGRWYPLLSGAIAGGLFHPNCRHTLSAWVEGVSKLPPPMDKEKIRRTAQLEQKQRQLEREVRSWKRLAEGSVDPQNHAMYSQRVKQAQNELREFVGEHSDVLRRDYWREATNQVPADYAPVPLQNNGAGGILKADSAPGNTGQDLRYNSEADFNIRLPNYSEVVNAGLSAASRKVAQLGGRNQREYLSLVDLSDGGEVYFEQGEEGSVGGPAFWDVVRSNPSGNYCFVHNHNREGGFSERDLHTLLTTSSIRAFAAIGVDGMKFFVEKTGTKPSTGFFDKLYPDDISKINALYASGKITAGERTGLREQLLVENVIRDYTKGLVVLDGRTGKE